MKNANANQNGTPVTNKVKLCFLTLRVKMYQTNQSMSMNLSYFSMEFVIGDNCLQVLQLLIA